MTYDNLSQLGHVRLIGLNADNVPTNSILHYAKLFCENYTKLVILRRIMEAVRTDPSAEFILAPSSYPVNPDQIKNLRIPKSLYELENRRIAMEYDYLTETVYRPPFMDDDIEGYHAGYTPLRPASEKSRRKDQFTDPVEDFFTSLSRHVRPLVYQYGQNGRLVLIYDYESKDCVKLENMTYRCPPKFDFFGIISALRDLGGILNDHKEEKRREEEHRQNMKLGEKALENEELEARLLEEKIRTEKMRQTSLRALEIEGYKTLSASPERVQLACKEAEHQLLLKQRRSNMSFGIEEYKKPGFDEKA